MAERRRLAALIRHGAYHQRPGAPSALQPYPLTDAGLTQTRACGATVLDLLERHRVTLAPVIHCSAQLRAWQTADIIAGVLSAAGHAVTLCQTPALSERSVGSAANLTTAEIEQVLRDDPRFDPAPDGWKSDSHYCLPLQGAESLMQAGGRVAGHLRDAMRDADDDSLTLFVGHGASFRHAACHLGVLAEARIPAVSMHHADPLLVCYNGGDRWDHFAGAWKVRHRSEVPQD